MVRVKFATWMFRTGILPTWSIVGSEGLQVPMSGRRTDWQRFTINSVVRVWHDSRRARSWVRRANNTANAVKNRK